MGCRLCYAVDSRVKECNAFGEAAKDAPHPDLWPVRLVDGGCGALRCDVAGEFGDDLHTGAGSDARGSGFEHCCGIGERANSSGGFYTGAGPGDAAKQSDVVSRCSSGGEAGRGFEEVGSGGESDLGSAEFLFKRKKAGLEYDFDNGPLCVGQFDYAADVLANGFVVRGLAGFEQADVENHVDIMRAVLEDAHGFVAFGAGEGGSQGEAYERADGDSGALEFGCGNCHPGGVDHGAGETVLGRLVAELEDLVAGGVWFDEGVVDDCGEVLGRRESVSGEGLGVEVFGSGKGISNSQRIQKPAPAARGESRRVTFYHTGIRAG